MSKVHAVARAIAKVIAEREAPRTTPEGRPIDALGRTILVNQMVDSMAGLLTDEAEAAIKAAGEFEDA